MFIVKWRRNMPEQRHFHRIKFDVRTEIDINGTISAVPLVDISLKGAMVGFPLAGAPDLGSHCRVIIHLNDPDAIISFSGKIVHINDGLAGIKITLIDIDSMIHLRRLVALNSENSAQVNNELNALFASSREDL